MTKDERDDFCDANMCMFFYIPETRISMLTKDNPYPSEDKIDVYGTFMEGEYEYYNAEKICCSFCDGGVEIIADGTTWYRC